MKKSESQLKIDSQKNHFVWPVITKKMEQAVVSQMYESLSIYDRSGVIQEFEEKIAKIHNKKYCLLTNSGTTALYSMYVGLGLKKGDEVIVCSYGFPATITPLLFTGATPVFVDCDECANISPQAVVKEITHKTKAIVVSHMWSIPAKMDELKKIANENNIALLEDGSHAHFSKYGDKLVGTFGEVSAFSLQGQKTLTAGEGGFILTDNEKVYHRALLLGHYNKRCKQEIPKTNPLSAFSSTGMGLKLRAHPLAVKFALEQLEILPEIIEGRRNVALKIIKSLSKHKCISFPYLDSLVKNKINPTWYAITFTYDQINGISAKELLKILHERGCKEIDLPASTGPLTHHAIFNNTKDFFESNQAPRHTSKENTDRLGATLFKMPVWHENSPILEQYLEILDDVLYSIEVNTPNQEQIKHAQKAQKVTI